MSAEAAKKNPSLSYSWTGSQSKAEVARAQSKTGVADNRSYKQELNLSWPVWTFGQLEGAIDAARYQKNVKDLEVYKTEAETKLSAVKAYYDYLEKIKLADVAHESVNDYANHLENVQQQFDAGIVAKLDVLSSKVSLADAKQKSIAADNARDVAEASLNNVMRVPMNTKLNVMDKEFPEPEFDLTMDQAILMAQKYRWELVEADYGVKAAQAKLRSAKAGYMPTVSVSGGYSWNEAAVSEFDKDKWSVGGKLSWNIWDGGATQASVKKADAALKEAQESLLKARETVELNVRQAYLDVLSYKEQIRASEASVAQAEEAYKIATVRYSSGVGINLDVLDAELKLSEARKNYITALYSYNISLATLERAMGIPAVMHPEFEKAK